VVLGGGDRGWGLASISRVLMNSPARPNRDLSRKKSKIKRKMTIRKKIKSKIKIKSRT
jgi:hypothetical protein